MFGADRAAPAVTCRAPAGSPRALALGQSGPPRSPARRGHEYCRRPDGRSPRHGAGKPAQPRPLLRHEQRHVPTATLMSCWVAGRTLPFASDRLSRMRQKAPPALRLFEIVASRPAALDQPAPICGRAICRRLGLGLVRDRLDQRVPKRDRPSAARACPGMAEHRPSDSRAKFEPLDRSVRASRPRSVSIAASGLAKPSQRPRGCDRRNHFSRAAVTIPSVPRHDQQMVDAYTAIVLLEAGESVRTVHRAAPPRSATSARIGPKRSTCVPPALVETSPPIVALPLAPRVSGKRSPCSATASWSSCSTTPASATQRIAPGSIERMRFIRLSERIRADPSSGGVAPPTIDVLPPCGTSATPFCAASVTIAATSSCRRRLEDRPPPCHASARASRSARVDVHMLGDRRAPAEAGADFVDQ